MSKRSLRDFGEVVALMGVIASLVFVGLELRENRIAARAAAYQELGIAVAENWMMRADNREMNDLVLLATTADSVAWASVNDSDRYLLRSYVVANIRLLETVHLQIEERLLAPEALDRLGWHLLLNSRLLERTWPDVRPAVTPAFVAYMEAAQPRLRAN